jgi:hypothetical protein
MSHPGMMLAVEGMVARLKLSGLCGFDFILSAEDGTAHFLELNPRATPTCHLIAADGKDLLAAVYCAVQGCPDVNRQRNPRFEPIALFPQEVTRHRNSPFLQSAYQDVPKSRDLVTLAMQGIEQQRWSRGLFLSRNTAPSAPAWARAGESDKIEE